jgi:hypothetical protein
MAVFGADTGTCISGMWQELVAPAVRTKRLPLSLRSKEITEAGSRFLQNVGEYLWDYMTSRTSR